MSNLNNGQDNPHHARARAEMVERLRRHYHIRDERVLAAMERIPRHLFVPEALQSHAYGDHALPIEFNQTISQPYIVARQTELLEVTRDDRTLEIGAGSGYQTSVLAAVAGQVFALLVAAAAPDAPKPLIDQLAVGGRLIIPVGTETEQRLIRVTRTPEGMINEDFGACQFVKLIGRFGWER